MSKEDGNNRLWLTINLADSTGRRVNHSMEYDDGVTWDKILKDFVNALHGYGYVGVDKFVFVQAPFTNGTEKHVMLRDIEPYLEADYE